jgi:hypothetical protein
MRPCTRGEEGKHAPIYEEGKHVFTDTSHKPQSEKLERTGAGGQHHEAAHVTKQARAQGDDLWKPHCLSTLLRLRRSRPAERPDLHLKPGPAPCARTCALPNFSATVVRRACALSLSGAPTARRL